jgi:hypothetical protein
MIMQWCPAELPCVYVYLISVVAQASQAIGGVFTVKPAAWKYCSGGVD